MHEGTRFQEELAALRSGGRAFAHANPKLARHLYEKSNDPDVERLLEGFAFLTSRIRDKLDAEVPELDQSMIQLLWPQFLRPLPSFTLLTFQPDGKAGRQVVPAGAQIQSNLINGVSCEFRTTTECAVAPVTIVGTKLNRDKDGASLQIDLNSTVPASQLGLETLRIWFCGDASTAQTLYFWTRRYLSEIRIRVQDRVVAFLPASRLEPGGLDASEMLLPIMAMAFRGYQLLQEYFTFPDKFYCVDLTDFRACCADIAGTDFSIELRYGRALPSEVKLRPRDVRLFCVPAVNLYPADAEPLAVDHRKATYPVTVQSRSEEADEEIFSIDGVTSWSADEDGNAIRRVYPRFESFEHETEQRKNHVQAYYRETLKPAGRSGGFQHELSFVLHDGRGGVPTEETLSIELTCFSRHLSSELAVGDICIPGSGIPQGLGVTNVIRPTPPVFPPLDGALDWTLIANLSLNYMTLLELNALTAIMAIYDTLPASDRRAEQAARKRTEGMVSLLTVPQEKLLNGLPIRGLKSVLELREDCFQTEGDMYLFASVIAEFFRLYTTTNAFHELEVRGVLYGEVYRWPAKTGR